MYETHLHEYGHYDQSIGAFSSFCVICVQLMIVVDQLNLKMKKRHADVTDNNMMNSLQLQSEYKTLDF